MRRWLAYLVGSVALPIILSATLSAGPAAAQQNSRPQKISSATVAKGKLEAAKLETGGRNRTYLFQLPSDYSAARRWPLVIGISGDTQSGHDAARISRFDEYAYGHGIIAVFPDSAGGWDLKGTSDEDFFSAIMNKFEADYSADPSRLYVTGGASGALLIFKLACEMANRFAAVAPVIGTMPEALSRNCHPARPIPLVEINGTSDDDVRYDGGIKLGLFGNFGTRLMSAPSSLQWWAQTDGCPENPTQEILPRKTEDGLDTRVDRYSGCRDGTAVVLYTVIGGGHTWPGGQGLPRIFFGKTSQDLNADDVIWQFFQAHPLPGRNH